MRTICTLSLPYFLVVNFTSAVTEFSRSLMDHIKEEKSWIISIGILFKNYLQVLGCPERFIFHYFSQTLSTGSTEVCLQSFCYLLSFTRLSYTLPVQIWKILFLPHDLCKGVQSCYISPFDKYLYSVHANRYRKLCGTFKENLWKPEKHNHLSESADGWLVLKVTLRVYCKFYRHRV